MLFKIYRYNIVSYCQQSTVHNKIAFYHILCDSYGVYLMKNTLSPPPHLALTAFSDLLSFFDSLSLSLCWGLGLCLHFILVRCFQQHLWQCLLIFGWVNRPLRCFVLPVCVCLCVCFLHLSLPLWGWVEDRVTFIAQIPHVQQSLHQRLDKFCWACLWALVEAGDGEDDVVWLRVVAGSISILNHRSVAAEHLNSCRNLRKGYIRFIAEGIWITDVSFLGFKELTAQSKAVKQLLSQAELQALWQLHLTSKWLLC